MTAYVGIDLAWSARNRTGLAVVDGDGRLVASGNATTDVEIDAWLAENAPAPRTVGIDAPLIVPNETGQRDAEREIGRAYGRFGAGAYPSNRANPLFNPPRGKQLAERHGWTMDPLDRSATSQCIEDEMDAVLCAHLAWLERLGITVGFVLPARHDSPDEWDLDNLLKPTIDALIDILGIRPVASARPQTDDERLDAIKATKRRAIGDEAVAARIEIWPISDRD